MNDIASLSATKLVDVLKNKKMGSLELLEFYKERYERLNPRVNAIVATNFDSAQKRAKEADIALARGEVWGPLHGLPMTIKDSIPVAGMPYTFGMPIAKDFIPSANADVVESLLDAGAIIFGKTNVPFRGLDTLRKPTRGCCRGLATSAPPRGSWRPKPLPWWVPYR